MENVAFSFSVVAPLCILMACGYGLRYLFVLADDFLKILNNLVFRFFLPILLMMNIYHTSLDDSYDPALLIFASVCLCLVFVIATCIVPLFEKQNARRGVLIQGIFRSNFVLFGMPVAVALCGSEKTGKTALLIAVAIPLFNMFSVVALELFRSRKPQIAPILKGIISNPLIIAALCGIFLLCTGIRLPVVIEKPLNDIGSAATPLALLILGAGFQFRSVASHRLQLFVTVFCRLILVPVIGLGVALWLGFRNEALVGLLALFASPTAVSSFTMAQQMDGDADLAGNIVIFTTLCSGFTIFLWIFFFKQYGYI